MAEQTNSTICICGFNPPEDPNPDCERCQLIAFNYSLQARVAELEATCQYLNSDNERLGRLVDNWDGT